MRYDQKHIPSRAKPASKGPSSLYIAESIQSEGKRDGNRHPTDFMIENSVRRGSNNKYQFKHKEKCLNQLYTVTLTTCEVTRSKTESARIRPDFKLKLQAEHNAYTVKRQNGNADRRVVYKLTTYTVRRISRLQHARQSYPAWWNAMTKTTTSSMKRIYLVDDFINAAAEQASKACDNDTDYKVTRTS